MPDHQLTFTGPAKVFESEDEAVAGILNKAVVAGDVVVIRYEGPAGGPGMQEMLHPTSFLKGRKLADKCALTTDGRFSGGTSGLSVGHLSPEAASGGTIGLVQDGDLITIDIPGRSIRVEVDDDELLMRRNTMDSAQTPWQPRNRHRPVSAALQAYAAPASSADAAGRLPGYQQAQPMLIGTSAASGAA